MTENSSPEVVMVCGVPASGKSWVCEQMAEAGWDYVKHDYMQPNNHQRIADEAAKFKQVIIDCPYAERALRELLESKGMKVSPYFIVEDPWEVKRREFMRSGRESKKNVMTRAKTIVNRAMEWGSPTGTSSEILEMLKKLERRK